MIDVFIYAVDLPRGVHEMVTPCTCEDGYTIYVDIKDDKQSRLNHLLHAVRHISHGDFEKNDVQQIEAEAHKEVRR